MKLFFIQLTCLFVVGKLANANPITTEGYCWRDYDGIVPSDAVAAGLDKNHKSIYIGQALYEGKLIPGLIPHNDNRIYIEWYNVEYVISQNNKILCSHTPNKLKWVNTNKNEVVRLPSNSLIKGGVEENYFTYIGRIEINGVMQVGKVVCSANDCLGLYTSYVGGVKQYDQFQILTYDSSL